MDEHRQSPPREPLAAPPRPRRHSAEASRRGGRKRRPDCRNHARAAVRELPRWPNEPSLARSDAPSDGRLRRQRQHSMRRGTCPQHTLPSELRGTLPSAICRWRNPTSTKRTQAATRKPDPLLEGGAQPDGAELQCDVVVALLGVGHPHERPAMAAAREVVSDPSDQALRDYAAERG